jgi:hypothetical protein
MVLHGRTGREGKGYRLFKTHFNPHNMQIVYLKDGTKAKLITKADSGYIVDPLIICVPYDGDEGDNEVQELSGLIQQVDQVYDSPPRAAMHEEIKKLQSAADELGELVSQRTLEFNRVKYELEKIKKTVTDAGKMIINRQELKSAKRLVVWIKGRVAPRIMDDNNRLKLTISYTISQYSAEEKCWAYGCWDDSDERWSSYSEYFDPEYGIKTDLSDDEILSITHERQMKNQFDSSELNRVDDKWLTPANIELKRAALVKINERALVIAEEELQKAQQKYNRLKEAQENKLQTA